MSKNHFSLLIAKTKGKKGSASALIIMVLTVLTLLGVLSMVTVASDYRLSQKRASWQKDYFAADSEAVKLQAELDLQVKLLLLDNQQLSGSELTELIGQKLEEWMELQPVQDVTIKAEPDSLQIMASIGLEIPPGPSDQMIDLQFEVATDRGESDFGLLKVKKWSQWQGRPPATEEGGIIWIP